MSRNAGVESFQSSRIFRNAYDLALDGKQLSSGFRNQRVDKRCPLRELEQEKPQ